MNDAFLRFCSEVEGGEHSLCLDRAALVVALTAYPELCVEEYLDRLDELAAEADQRGRTDVMGLAAFLFHEEGFRGNMDDYYDPRNSFLNDVLDRKLGLPLTLSLLFIEVGRRLGHRIDGLPLPRHFLVRVQTGSRARVIDPFHEGSAVGDEELGARLGVVPAADEIASASRTQMLTRLLNNLKMIYLKADEPMKALEMVERLVVLNPEEASEVRDRGILFARLDCYKEAIRDLESYLERGPAPADVATVREAIAALAAKASDVH